MSEVISRARALKETAKHAERISNWGFFYAQREDHRFRPENSVIIDKKAYDRTHKDLLKMSNELEAIKQVIKDIAYGEINPYDGIPIERIKEILEGSY